MAEFQQLAAEGGDCCVRFERHAFVSGLFFFLGYLLFQWEGKNRVVLRPKPPPMLPRDRPSALDSENVRDGL